MLRKTRILWKVHKPISDVFYELGENDPKVTSKLIHELGERMFLSFSDMNQIYRSLSIESAALQALIEYAAGAVKIYGADSREAFITMQALKNFAPDVAIETENEALRRAAEP